MPVSERFLEFVLGQLDDLGDVSSRRMFGGAGLYHGDLFFGLLAGDRLFLKVDEGNRAMHERAGMRPFSLSPARTTTMQYYEVPVAVLEDPQALVRWARLAVEAAVRARAKKAAGPARAGARRRTR